MKHKSMWLVLFWLIFLTVAIGIQPFIPVGLPLVEIVTLAGYLTLAYVGISKGVNIVKAFQSPPGEFGFEYQPVKKDRMFWITIIWLLFIVEALIVRAFVVETIIIPIREVVVFAGLLSTVFVGANKGEKIGAAAGKPKEADECPGT